MSALHQAKYASKIIKRILDVVIAIIALIFCAPIILLTALVIRIRLGSPVFFRQQRPGFEGIPFFLIKFRTMSNECDEHGQLLPDEMRISSLGKFIRSSSIDELPQLINVLLGDMSLVGPRPLLMQYLHLYSANEARRHLVKPGITGWAQVNGRNNLKWKEKFDLDVWYVDNWSLALDFKILLMTAIAVVKRKDVVKDGHVTTLPYDGQN